MRLDRCFGFFNSSCTVKKKFFYSLQLEDWNLMKKVSKHKSNFSCTFLKANLYDTIYVVRFLSYARDERSVFFFLSNIHSFSVFYQHYWLISYDIVRMLNMFNIFFVVYDIMIRHIFERFLMFTQCDLTYPTKIVQKIVPYRVNCP